MRTVLEVKNLQISFRTSNGTVKAVRDISFDLQEGETLCIVGESGSGKSVTAKAILGILAGNSIVEGGEILYDGKDLLKISENEFNRVRGNDITMIFQDPMSSLDPIMRIGKQMTEATILNGKTNCKNARKRFHQGMKQLKKDLEAAGQSNVQPRLAAFEQAAREGGKRRKTYQTAVEYAESAITALEHLAVDLYKDDEALVRADAKTLLDKLDHVTDDLFLKQDDPELLDLRKGVQAMEKNYIAKDRAPVEAMLERGKALLTQALDAPRPDFCPDLDEVFVKTVSDTLPDGADRLERLKDDAFHMVNVVTKQMAYD
jgi:ABC-type antimicrobial peptide transport system ATPase subunit